MKHSKFEELVLLRNNLENTLTEFDIKETSYPSGTAQNEKNSKSGTTPMVPGSESKCLCILQMSNA